jgi:hypothetical protein
MPAAVLRIGSPALRPKSCRLHPILSRTALFLFFELFYRSATESCFPQKPGDSRPVWRVVNGADSHHRQVLVQDIEDFFNECGYLVVGTRRCDARVFEADMWPLLDHSGVPGKFRHEDRGPLGVPHRAPSMTILD